MQAKLYVNKSDVKKVDKTLTDEASVEITLKDDTSIIKPSILLHKDDAMSLNLYKYNYLYIPAFNRYYFINNLTSVRNHLWNLECSVDVLMSNKNAIYASKGIIARNEDHYNFYIQDGAYQTENRTRTMIRAFKDSDGNAFEFGAQKQDGCELVLTLVGGDGNA